MVVEVDITVQVAVERSADHARDALSVQLPLRPDREERVERSDILDGLKQSVFIGCVSTVVATLLGTLFAGQVQRAHGRRGG